MPETRIGYVMPTPEDRRRDLVADLERLPAMMPSEAVESLAAALRRAIEAEDDAARLRHLIGTCERYDHVDAVGEMLNWQKSAASASELIAELSGRIDMLEALVAWQHEDISEGQVCRITCSAPVDVREALQESVANALTRWAKWRECNPPSPPSGTST